MCNFGFLAIATFSLEVVPILRPKFQSSHSGGMIEQDDAKYRYQEREI
jgi:hypothetical protein